MTGAELAAAIETRRVVEFRYSGRRRVVHPHVLFRADAGGCHLDAVQIAGESSSGRLPDWRQFDLARIGAVTIREERFDVDPGFNPSGSKYRGGIVAAVYGS